MILLILSVLEATATIEVVWKWHHFLAGHHFTIVTDQKPVSFMFDNCKRIKVKNNKIQCWRLELALFSFSYDIKYRPGKENNAPDVLTRASCSAVPVCNLNMLHRDLCHPSVTHMLHFVQSKNLSFSTEDVKRVCSSCGICAELKPQFYCPKREVLIKATKPFECLSLDFKGLLPSQTRSTYLLVVVDEYSHLCPNMLLSTVIKCLD